MEQNLIGNVCPVWGYFRRYFVFLTAFESGWHWSPLFSSSAINVLFYQTIQSGFGHGGLDNGFWFWFWFWLIIESFCTYFTRNDGRNETVYNRNAPRGFQLLGRMCTNIFFHEITTTLASSGWAAPKATAPGWLRSKVTRNSGSFCADTLTTVMSFLLFISVWAASRHWNGLNMSSDGAAWSYVSTPANGTFQLAMVISPASAVVTRTRTGTRTRNE